ncbi:hypothetical protein L9F63_020680, partial [Diploptera punctata]
YNNRNIFQNSLLKIINKEAAMTTRKREINQDESEDTRNASPSKMRRTDDNNQNTMKIVKGFDTQDKLEIQNPDSTVYIILA